LEQENDLLEVDFEVILNLQMICCGHHSLRMVHSLITFQIILWDLWCENELVNQLPRLNQFKIRLLLQYPVT